MSIEVGSVVEGVVTGITNFGAFVELPEGKTGLIHISEVADVYVKDVHDFLQEKDKVKVKVLTIDDKGKIGLSIKAIQDKKPETEAKPEGGNSSFRTPRPPRAPMAPRGEFSRKPRYGSASFEDKLSKFLKDSDERQTDYRRRADSKRGGRGSRRG